MDEHVDELVQQRSKPTHERKWLVLTIIACVILVGAAAAVLIYKRTAANPLSKYASQVSFPIYYSSKLPDGYTLDPKSIKASSDLVFYRLAGSGKKPALVVTQQSMPDNFDASKLVGKNASALAVPVGTLYDISAGQQSKYMLTTGTSLIFVNSTGKLENGIANSLASNLQKVE